MYAPLSLHASHVLEARASTGAHSMGAQAGKKKSLSGDLWEDREKTVAKDIIEIARGL